MKKRISVLVCALIVISLFTSCVGGDDLTGTWEATIDVSETVGSGIIDEMTNSAPDIKDTLDISGLTLAMRITFTEDGGYSASVTAESFDAMLSTLAAKTADGLLTYANKLITENNLEIDVNTVFGLEEGQTLEAKVKELFASEEFEQILAENVQSGVYKAKEGKLFTAENADSFNEEQYETYVLTGDKLEITGSVGMSEEATSVTANAYPITYKKIS